MLKYQCCFCGLGVSANEKSSELDPCSIILIGHYERPQAEQKEQQFFGHFECFRKSIKDESYLYINEPDFPTNSDVS